MLTPRLTQDTKETQVKQHSAVFLHYLVTVSFCVIFNFFKQICVGYFSNSFTFSYFFVGLSVSLTMIEFPHSYNNNKKILLPNTNRTSIVPINLRMLTISKCGLL